MSQISEYKGYEIVETRNKKFVSQIKNNLHTSQNLGNMGNKLLYEPPIKFVHKNYESMIEFMDSNPK